MDKIILEDKMGWNEKKLSLVTESWKILKIRTDRDTISRNDRI